MLPEFGMGSRYYTALEANDKRAVRIMARDGAMAWLSKAS